MEETTIKDNLKHKLLELVHGYVETDKRFFLLELKDTIDDIITYEDDETQEEETFDDEESGRDFFEGN